MKINFSLDEETMAFEKTIKKIYKTALKLTNVTDKISVNVVLVNKDEIKEMNKAYRDVDRVTDVLSFPMIENIKNIENEIDFITGECNIGDIYINLERAKEQAEEYGHSLEREFCFLSLHGFLHLLGYDHMNEKDEKEMFSLQNEILEIVGIKR